MNSPSDTSGSFDPKLPPSDFQKSAPTETQVLCPYCRTVLSVNAALVGVSLTCPNCNGVFQCPVLGTNAQDAPNGGAYPGSTYGSPPFQNVPYQGGPYGAPYGGPVHPVQAFASKKVAAGICGILIGGLGIHKFVLGFNTAGILMLLATVIGSVTGVCLIVPILAPMAMGVIGLIEGILYLTKSDEEFYQAYAIQRREWF